MTPTERFMRDAGREGSWADALADAEAWKAAGKANGWEAFPHEINGITSIVSGWRFRFNLFMNLVEKGKTVDDALTIIYTAPAS